MISFTRIKNGASAELIAYRKNRVISIILLAFAAVIYGYGTNVSDRGYLDPSGLAIFLYFTSLLCLYSACTGSFKDMHDRPSADVQMSMPLRGAERYLSRLLTVGYIWLFPFLASAALGIITAVFVKTVSNEMFLDDAVLLVTESLKLLIWFLAAALFIIAVTVVCQCCTGAKAESKYTPVLLMLAASCAPYAVYTLTENLFGAADCGDGVPFYSVWSFSQLFSFGTDEPGFVLFAVINCLVSLAVLAGGMFIYKKRDARSVDMPVAYPLFLEITVFLLLLMLFCMVHADNSVIVFFLAWLGSVILRIICARKSFSVKKIALWTGLFAAYYAIFLLLMFLIFRTGGFGSMYRKADLDQYQGMFAKANLYIAEEYSYPASYYNESRETLADSDWSVSSADADRIMDICAEYAKRSAGTKGIFSSEMFGTDGVRLYECRVKIWVGADSGYNYSISYDQTLAYSVTFKLTREDAIELRKELSSQQNA